MHPSRPIEIQDPADSRLAEYQSLPDRQLHHLHEGLFIAEGELVVRKLIESEYTVRSVLLTPASMAKCGNLLDALDDRVPIYVVPQPVVTDIIGFPMHRGVLAIGNRGPVRDWRVLASASASLLILEDLSNHDNIGGMFRNAAALGGQGCAVLVTERCADPLYRKSVRVSMGHALRVPWAQIPACEPVIPELRAMGFLTVALTPGEDATDITAFSPPARAALIVGTEGRGLLPATAAAADARVGIAMAPGVDSLNVYVAAAVAMHRLIRPR